MCNECGCEIVSAGSARIEVKSDLELDLAYINQQIVNKVAKIIHEEVADEVMDTVRDTLQDKVNEALVGIFDRQITPTDSYGRPRSEPMTIAEMLQRDAKKWLTEKVDSKGRKECSSYSAKEPRIHWLLREALGVHEREGSRKTTLRQMIVQCIKEQLGDVRAIVDAHVKEALEDSFKRAVRKT